MTDATLTGMTITDARTEPVDVLAVMDECTDQLEAQPGCYYTDAAKLQEARAAIAELIEAAGRTVRYADSEPDGGEQVEVHRANIERMRAALARVGGGK